MIKQLHGPADILHSHIIDLIANENNILIEFEGLTYVNQEIARPLQLFEIFAVVMYSQNPVRIDIQGNGGAAEHIIKLLEFELFQVGDFAWTIYTLFI